MTQQILLYFHLAEKLCINYSSVIWRSESRRFYHTSLFRRRTQSCFFFFFVIPIEFQLFWLLFSLVYIIMVGKEDFLE